MLKRGQITIFIILGIVLLAVVVIVWSLQKDTLNTELQKTDINLAYEAANVKQYVTQCAEDHAKQSLIAMGYYGGHEALQGPFYNSEVLNANYLFYDQKIKATNSTQLEERLSKILSSKLQECLPKRQTEQIGTVETDAQIVDHNLIFRGLEVNQISPPKASVSLTNEQAIFTVNWPVLLHDGVSERTISEFILAPIPTRINEMNYVAQQIAYKSQFEIIDVFSLLNYSYTYDLFYGGNDSYIVVITDNQTRINEHPLRFLFALKMEADQQ